MRAGCKIYIASRFDQGDVKAPKLYNLRGPNTCMLFSTLLVMRHTVRLLQLKIKPSIHLVRNQLAVLLLHLYHNRMCDICLLLRL